MPLKLETARVFMATVERQVREIVEAGTAAAAGLHEIRQYGLDLAKRAAKSDYKCSVEQHHNSGLVNRLEALLDSCSNVVSSDVSRLSSSLDQLVSGSDGIRGWILFGNDFLTVNIFKLSPHKTMPIHDHPFMTGMIKIIAGNCQLCTYDPIGDDSCQKERMNSNLFRKEVKIMNEKDSGLLLPYKNNIHSLFNDSDHPLIFLDILSPSYGYIKDSDITYFREKPVSTIKNLDNNKALGKTVHLEPIIN